MMVCSKQLRLALTVFSTSLIAVVYYASSNDIVTRPASFASPNPSVSSRWNRTSVRHTNCTKYTPPDVGVISENARNLSIVIPSSAIVDQTESGFTVLVLVYTRAAALREIVLHYVCMKAVDRIVVLWAAEMDPPAINATSSEILCLHKLVVQKINSKGLTTRFKPNPHISTDAVFNIDDDQLVAEDDVNTAFDVWKNHPWSLVGFNKRRYRWTGRGGFTYGTFGEPYHFILTSAAFIHRNLLELFDRHLNPEMREQIDRQRNCEDLAMNVLAGDYCRCTVAFYVRTRHTVKIPKAAGKTLRRGLAFRPKHFAERNQCLNKLSKLYHGRLAPNWCIY